MDENPGNVYNISARGARVIISYGDNYNPIVLDDFADDQDPIMIDELDLGETAFDINGKLFRKSKLEPVTMHIAVIPGSEDEMNLNDAILTHGIGMFGCPTLIKTLTVKYPNDREVTFYNGFHIGASMGYAATSQGRIRTKNYSFSFKSCGPATSN